MEVGAAGATEARAEGADASVGPEITMFGDGRVISSAVDARGEMDNRERSLPTERRLPFVASSDSSGTGDSLLPSGSSGETSTSRGDTSWESGETATSRGDVGPGLRETRFIKGEDSGSAGTGAVKLEGTNPVLPS